MNEISADIVEAAWQETAGFWFSIAQGHTGTEPDAFRHDPVWEAVKNNGPQYLVPSQLSGFLRAHEVSSVVVDDSVSTSWGPMLEAVTGSGPLEVGGIDLFRVPPRR